MSTDTPDGVIVRPADTSIRQFEQDSSAGLSQNGTTHTTPETTLKNGAVTFDRYTVPPGTKFTIKQKKALINNLDTCLELLPDDQKLKLVELVNEYRKDLGMAPIKPLQEKNDEQK
jgi:hypothetical protein